MIQKTVQLDDKNNALLIIDQTALPGELLELALTSQQDIWDALHGLKVRGAPAIGVAAAIGIYLAALALPDCSYAAFYRSFAAARDFLASARPTAVNLFWALKRMENVVLQHPQSSLSDIKVLLHDEAIAILEEDIRACRAIGEFGLSLLANDAAILTHCNAGQLAAVEYGTALAPIYLGCERGYRFKVFVDETRPLLQGARLTAYELAELGVETTLICDNMAADVIARGWVQAVLVGSDRIAANGDTCNKIGTLSLAIIARHYGIPFYVLAPTSTIDLETAEGIDIPIEQRPASEITQMWYKQPMAPAAISVYNPAFDVVPHDLISAIVTERGILYEPCTESIRQYMLQS